MNSFMKELLGWEAMLCGYANYLTAKQMKHRIYARKHFIGLCFMPINIRAKAPA